MNIFGFEVTRKKKRNIGELFMPLMLGQEAISTDDFDSLVKAYRSWVYVCAHKNMISVAQVPLRLYRAIAGAGEKGTCPFPTKEIGSRQLDYLMSDPIVASLDCVKKGMVFEEILEHPFLTMMRNVNPFMNRFDLWEQTQMFLELTGNAYWYVVPNAFGVPSQIWVLPSNKTKIVPDKVNFIKGYVYREGIQGIPFEEKEIVHFKFANSTNSFYGKGPLAAVASAYNINENISKFENALFSNMARPEGVLETEQSLDDDEFERMKKQWQTAYGGVTKAGKTAILEKGLKYSAITFKPRDLNHVEGRKGIREEIAAGFGVPISMLTSENVNKANAWAGEYQYAKNTILPRLRKNEEKLNEKILPRYSPNLFAAFDNPVPEDRTERTRERESNLRTGYSSINLERKEDRKEPVEWGDVPILQMQMVPLGSAPPKPTPQQLEELTDLISKEVKRKVLSAKFGG